MNRLEGYGRSFGPDLDGIDDPTVEEDYEFFSPLITNRAGDIWVPCTQVA